MEFPLVDADRGRGDREIFVFIVSEECDGIVMESVNWGVMRKRERRKKGRWVIRGGIH